MTHSTHADSGAGTWAVATYGLSKRYRGETALDGVDLHLAEVGVFAAAEDGAPGAPLYLRMHRIRSGEQRITVNVPGEPARASSCST